MVVVAINLRLAALNDLKPPISFAEDSYSSVVFTDPSAFISVFSSISDSETVSISNTTSSNIDDGLYSPLKLGSLERSSILSIYKAPICAIIPSVSDLVK